MAAKNTIDSLIAMGIKREINHGVATIIPWPQSYWEPVEHP